MRSYRPAVTFCPPMALVHALAGAYGGYKGYFIKFVVNVTPILRQGLEDTLWERAGGTTRGLSSAGPGQFHEYASLSAAIQALNARAQHAHEFELRGRDRGVNNGGGENELLSGGRNLHVFAREVNSKGTHSQKLVYSDFDEEGCQGAEF